MKENKINSHQKDILKAIDLYPNGNTLWHTWDGISRNGGRGRDRGSAPPRAILLLICGPVRKFPVLRLAPSPVHMDLDSASTSISYKTSLESQSH